LAGALGRQLSAIDIDFLRALPGGSVVDLDRQMDLDRTEPGLPSVLWSVLWEASAAGRLGDGLRKRTVFALRGKRFEMELDLAESPECGYWLRDPTVQLTRILVGGGQTMLDIGANAGFHALTAALFYRRVHAFEPTPATADRLERNVAFSRLPNVEVERIGLSDRDGTARFAVRPGHCGGNRITEGEPGAVEVPIRRLDGMLGERPFGMVDLIKIDVEGHECEVLAGAVELVARDRPRLFVEFNDAERFERFLALLPSGYHALRPLADGGHRPITSAAAAVAARDVLFVGR
jgi:FkbM family methyltransferase